MPGNTHTTIAVVGGGCSGSLAAVQLVRAAASGVRVALIERGPRFARGIAYGTGCPQHLLNVPAGRMSALPDDPSHFLRWASARDATLTSDSFARRALYGEYLESLLAATCDEAGAGFQRIHDAVIGLSATSGGARAGLRLQSGGTLAVDRVVLALGNFMPADPPLADRRFFDSPRYARDPWSPGATQGLSADDDVLLIGTGLTAVDVIAQLDAAGHRGVIHAASRHGLLPRVHTAKATVAIPAAVSPGMGVRESLQAVRAACESHDWRGVVDGLRPVSQAIWRAWSVEQRRQFVRHLRLVWDVHRHRVAPDVFAAVEHRQRNATLAVHAGRVDSIVDEREGVIATLRPRGGGSHRRLTVARVINCTGPDCDPRRLDDPLVRDLLASGLARPDRLRLGFYVGPGGELIDATGRASDWLYAIGPLRRAELWETVAVPEIRTQAAELAQTLTSHRL